MLHKSLVLPVGIIAMSVSLAHPRLFSLWSIHDFPVECGFPRPRTNGTPADFSFSVTLYARQF